ncbi:hypothetical protein MMC19_000383 [Ptychographa xylographoides]|nr:hypothetical protein [Ptychographa xylographoides]
MPQDKIECSLIKSSLVDDTQKYEALSYHWGDQEPNHEIWIRSFKGDTKVKTVKHLRTIHDLARYVKPQKFYIRPNLHAALQQFRLQERDLVLWIDALCINQKDQQEKNQQVSRMANIYSRAENVCVWLGEGNEQSDKALHFVPKILDLSHFDILVNDEKFIDHWNALENLMRSTWFNRRWVIQEIAMAREATLHCGKEEIHWGDFADAVALFVAKVDSINSLIRTSKGSSDSTTTIGDIKALGANILVDAISNLFRKSDDSLVLEPLSSLETLVSTLLTFESGDPRDTIYALLSLAKNTSTVSDSRWRSKISSTNIVDPVDKQRMSLKADYTKSILQVYKDFTNFCIQSSGSLDIICRHWAPSVRKKPFTAKEAIRLGKMRSLLELPSLPSWVPGVANSAFGAPEDTFNGRRNGDSLVGRPDRKQYNAAPGSLARVRFGENSRGRHSQEFPLPDPILLAPSLDVISIHSDSPENGSPTESALQYDIALNDVSQMNIAGRSLSHAEPSFEGSMYVYGFQIDTIATLSARLAMGMILNESLQMGGLGDSDNDNTDKVPDQLWRTLVADRGPNGINPPGWYHRACLHCLANRTNTGDINTGVLIETGKPSMMVQFLRRVEDVIWNRKFLKSSTRGLFGLAPTQAQESDIICILYGCSVPVILREHNTDTGDYFELIGESYIHGMMDGDAMIGERNEREFELR